MPIDIAPTTAPSTLRPLQAVQGDVQPTTVDAAALDPETRFRLNRLNYVLKAARAAAENRLGLTQEWKSSGSAALGPALAEMLADQTSADEIKRKKQKDDTLLTALRSSLDHEALTKVDVLKACQFLLPQIVPDEDRVIAPGFEAPMKNPGDLDAGGLIWNSHSDFYAQVSALLEALKSNWLSKYQDALDTYLEFYQKFADIMEKIKFQAEGDKGDVSFNFNEVRGELDALMREYGLTGEPLATFPNEAAAQAFKDSLGLPGLEVVAGADGTYKVMMDVSAVKQLVDGMPTGWVRWDSAYYNSWLSAKDSNTEQIKHASKVLGEKLSEMTQKYDSVVKILSSTIDKITEADMSFVHGL